MGSPNFYTNTDMLNLGIELSYYDEDDEFDIEIDQMELHDSFEMIKEKVDNLDTLFFHRVYVENGYHSGFQVFIESAGSDEYLFKSEIVSDWNKYKSFLDVNGNEYTELTDCPYFRNNLKNITPFELARAIKREYRYLHNELLKIGEEFGLGEVVGQTWTSSLHYPILSKKIN